MQIGGRLKKRYKAVDEDQQAKREITAYDREILSKDISYILKELHDDAMNFKGVSIQHQRV